jgi:large subunit ribosomal protein L10
MSKVIKQMQMTALRNTFEGVRDLVMLSVKGLSCQADHTLRSSLRKKKVRLQVVKNSLTRRVFDELGIHLDKESPVWTEPTLLAWGADSVAELSRAIQGELKDPKRGPLYKDQVKVKTAIAEGEPIPFEDAVKLPTRQDAIASVLATILSAGANIAGCLTGPISQVASQIENKSKEEEKKEGAEAPAG